MQAERLEALKRDMEDVPQVFAAVRRAGGEDRESFFLNAAPT